MIYLGCTLFLVVSINARTSGEAEFPAPKITIADSHKLSITYHLQRNNTTSRQWLSSIRSQDSLGILMAVNRTDRMFLNWLDTLIVPDTFVLDTKAYSPFPACISSLCDIHKVILFSYRLQAFGAYQNGNLQRWGPVSMGQKSTLTPTGLFHTNWKTYRAISTVNRDWIMYWYFNLDNFTGMSMHQYALPGFPSSHQCIRLLEKDARWLYYWAEQWILKDRFTIAAYGTPVLIFGNYAFGKRRPWMAGKNAQTITEGEIQTTTNKFLSIVLSRQQRRDSVLQAHTPSVK